MAWTAPTGRVWMIENGPYEPPRPPSIGSRRCMIYKHDRQLEDACDGCSLSATYCAASRDINRQPCCTTCTH